MKIENFINSLLPNFETSRITTDIRIVREEIVETTLGGYQKASTVFTDQNWKSEFARKFDKALQPRIDDYKTNYIVTITTGLTRILKTLDTLNEFVQQEFNNDVMRDSLTYVRANAIQYVELASFVASYSRLLLLITFTAETNRQDSSSDDVNARDVQWLLKNQDSFIVALRASMLGKKEVATKLADIPKTIIREGSIPTDRQVVGASRLDPFQFGLIPRVMNPIYHVRMAITRYQVSRYKLAKEEKEALELRLLDLRNRRNGKRDAHLEKSIEYSESRVEKLRYKIHRMETESGDS